MKIKRYEEELQTVVEIRDRLESQGKLTKEKYARIGVLTREISRIHDSIELEKTKRLKHFRRLQKEEEKKLSNQEGATADEEGVGLKRKVSFDENDVVLDRKQRKKKEKERMCGNFRNSLLHIWLCCFQLKKIQTTIHKKIKKNQKIKNYQQKI